MRAYAADSGLLTHSCPTTCHIVLDSCCMQLAPAICATRLRDSAACAILRTVPATSEAPPSVPVSVDASCRTSSSALCKSAGPCPLSLPPAICAFAAENFDLNTLVCHGLLDKNISNVGSRAQAQHAEARFRLAQTMQTPSSMVTCKRACNVGRGNGQALALAIAWLCSNKASMSSAAACSDVQQ